MGMSEPGYGTDVLGHEHLGDPTGAMEAWLLNGRKMWITNGVIDDGEHPSRCLHGLCQDRSRTHDGRPQITTFIVERGMDGYSVGQKIRRQARA